MCSYTCCGCRSFSMPANFAIPADSTPHLILQLLTRYFFHIVGSWHMISSFRPYSLSHSSCYNEERRLTLANLKIDHVFCRQMIYIGVIEHDHCTETNPVTEPIMVAHLAAITALTHPRHLHVTPIKCIILQQSTDSLRMAVAVSGRNRRLCCVYEVLRR